MKFFTSVFFSTILLTNAIAKPLASDKYVSFIATSQLVGIVKSFKRLGFSHNRANNECAIISNTLFVDYEMTPNQKAYIVRFCLDIVREKY